MKSWFPSDLAESMETGARDGGWLLVLCSVWLSGSEIFHTLLFFYVSLVVKLTSILRDEEKKEGRNSAEAKMGPLQPLLREQMKSFRRQRQASQDSERDETESSSIESSALKTGLRRRIKSLSVNSGDLEIPCLWSVSCHMD